MLKNWTVITQPVRLGSDGIIIREHYLLNKKHPNHKNTENLISIMGSSKTSNIIALTGEKFRLNQQLYNRKGGRPLSSFAVEYCLTLPQGYRFSPDQWLLIVKDCSLALAKLCKLNKEEFSHYKQQIRAVLHQQKQEGNNSGDHTHLIISKIGKNRILKELQQKKATRVIKQAFNHAVLKHAGIDYRSYKPIEKERGRRLSTWQYQNKKTTESLEIEKTIIKMQNQIEKWIEAKNENDEIQLRRQKNRLIKTYEELKIKSLSEPQKETINIIKNKFKLQ
ncbi:hypothetical protein AB6D92_17725 [Vibrio splendidus]